MLMCIYSLLGPEVCEESVRYRRTRVMFSKGKGTKEGVLCEHVANFSLAESRLVKVETRQSREVVYCAEHCSCTDEI